MVHAGEDEEMEPFAQTFQARATATPSSKMATYSSHLNTPQCGNSKHRFAISPGGLYRDTFPKGRTIPIWSKKQNKKQNKQENNSLFTHDAGVGPCVVEDNIHSPYRSFPHLDLQSQEEFHADPTEQFDPLSLPTPIFPTPPCFVNPLPLRIVELHK